MPWQLITGGCRFIGSCYVLQERGKNVGVVNLDKMTYAGNPENLASLVDEAGYVFVRGDIGNTELVTHLLETYQPDAVVNFAAESHVDRSIADPNAFVSTNVLGTSVLLNAVKDWWLRLPAQRKSVFRFLHVSTDEVFGALKPTDPPFSETTPYAPNSPYSASKAGSDHLVRAFHATYGLPVLISNCSNNYGPRQFPEKLIPLVILNALERKLLPVYGKGDHIRDWLHVEDHCAAVARILQSGKTGESYCIGGHSERTNLAVVQGICDILDELAPSDKGSYSELITFVADRPGHDFRMPLTARK